MENKRIEKDEGQTVKGRGAENVGRRAMWRKKGGPERGTALWTHLSELGQRTHPGFSSCNTCRTVLGKLVWQGPQSHLEAELGLASPQAPLSCHRSGALGTCYEQNMEQKESSTLRKYPNHLSLAKGTKPEADQAFGSSCWFTGNTEKSMLNCTLGHNLLNLDCERFHRSKGPGSSADNCKEKGQRGENADNETYKIWQLKKKMDKIKLQCLRIYTWEIKPLKKKVRKWLQKDRMGSPWEGRGEGAVAGLGPTEKPLVEPIKFYFMTL